MSSVNFTFGNSNISGGERARLHRVPAVAVFIDCFEKNTFFRAIRQSFRPGSRSCQAPNGINSDCKERFMPDWSLTAQGFRLSPTFFTKRRRTAISILNFRLFFKLKALTIQRSKIMLNLLIINALRLAIVALMLYNVSS